MKKSASELAAVSKASDTGSYRFETAFAAVGMSRMGFAAHLFPFFSASLVVFPMARAIIKFHRIEVENPYLGCQGSYGVAGYISRHQMSLAANDHDCKAVRLKHLVRSSITARPLVSSAAWSHLVGHRSRCAC